MPRGGKRPGSGRPPGAQNVATINKEQARDALRQIVLERMRDLADAQLANATGLKYLVTRDKKSGKFVRVTEAMARLKQEDTEDLETIEVWEKDPNIAAFTDLMDRALDKPKAQVQEVSITGELTMVNPRLAAARKRLAANR